MKRPSKRFKALLGVGIILLLTFTLTDSAATEASPKHPSGKVPKVKKQVVETYGKLPLSFEANRGQTDALVKFLSRGRGYTLFLTPGEAVLAVRKVHGKPSTRLHKAAVTPDQPPETTTTVLRMQLIGANPTPRIVGLDALPSKSNYFIGNDPQKWQTNVPRYARIAYEDVYPGIDLVYHSRQRQLEYDFIVGPGADPKTIALSFQGADRVQIDAKGDLVLYTPSGLIRQNKPLVYQEVDGIRQGLRGGYVLNDKNRVGFDVAAYDASKPLVIDPVLSYSTYLGGDSTDAGDHIAVHCDTSAVCNAYVTGETSSIEFPNQNAFQTEFGGAIDVFVAKLNAAGNELVYSTYLGGTGRDEFPNIAVDADGNAYVTGSTASSDFPTTDGAFQPDLRGPGDAFVAKLNAAGALDYATYLGGINDEAGYGIAVDADGNAYVTGWTASSDFPKKKPFQDTFGGGDGDTFMAKLNAAGTALVYSSYLGGTGDESGSEIVVDTARNAYVIGDTDSRDFPTTPGAFQPTFGGGYSDAFVVKLAATGAVDYATYLGGRQTDFGFGIAVHCDPSAVCNAFVTGHTRSLDFPTAGPLQGALAGKNCSDCPYDAFVTNLNDTGTGLLYSTYLGGREGDTGYGIATDSDGNAYVTGQTKSRDFPSKKPFQRRFGGGPDDAFVAKLNAAGDALVYSSYLGGGGSEVGLGVAVDSAGDAYVTGWTNSTDFPTENAFQDTFGGSSDAFVTKVSGESDSGGNGGGGGPDCEKKPNHPKCRSGN